MLKLLLVELIGTFILALLVGTLLINAGVGSYVAFYIPCGAAVTVGLFTYCFSESELGSLNPAVALGKYLANKLSILGLGVAVGSELVGAYCGILLARFLNDAPLLVPQGYSIRADIGELIGTALFVFIVVRSTWPDCSTGWWIGSRGGAVDWLVDFAISERRNTEPGTSSWHGCYTSELSTDAANWGRYRSSIGAGCTTGFDQ